MVGWEAQGRECSSPCYQQLVARCSKPLDGHLQAIHAIVRASVHVMWLMSRSVVLRERARADPPSWAPSLGPRLTLSPSVALHDLLPPTEPLNSRWRNGQADSSCPLRVSVRLLFRQIKAPGRLCLDASPCKCPPRTSRGSAQHRRCVKLLDISSMSGRTSSLYPRHILDRYEACRVYWIFLPLALHWFYSVQSVASLH